jgi:hypothetical protein
LLAAILVFCFAACSKNATKSAGSQTGGTQTGGKATLSLSQQNVQKGQPLIAAIPTGVSAENIHWTVTPATLTNVSTANGQAMILFAQAGTYKVTASYSGSASGSADTSWAPVTVSDTVYTPTAPPQSYDTTLLTGDQITLTPMVDSIGNLLFYAQTTNNYGCFNNLLNLVYSGFSANGGIKINFYEVISADSTGCNGVQNPANAYLFPGATSSWPAATYPFVVNLGTTTYSGWLVVTANGYSFVWNYNSGVIISPLQVNK